MVHKYQSPVRVYKYPFEFVMAAYEKRFPTCKMIPVFLGSDIISDETSEDGAIHVVQRRCKLDVDAPYILKKLASVDYVYFMQCNTLDRRNRTLKIEAYNESFSSRVTVKEQCFYSVHPENPDWTCFEQTASLDIKSFFGFESTLEKIAMKQYTLNIKKGKEVIEYYINELQKENITYIPPWTETKKEGKSAEECSGLAKGMKTLSCQDADVCTTSDAASSLYSQAEGTSKNAEDKRTQAEDTSIEADKKNKKSVKLECSVNSGKLEAEYIQRCLGHLTPLQESQLVQLRQWLQETHKGKIPKDAHILRFLRARQFNIEKAREMLVHSLAWRKLHNIDHLLDNYRPSQVIQKYYPGGWHFSDNDGRPIYILRLGQMDVKGLMKAVGEETVLKHVIAVNEEGVQRAAAATEQLGYPVSGCTWIMDLENLSMRHLWRPGIKALLRIIEIVQANYPETMGRLLIVRAPRVFPVLWTLVSPFIDDNTRTKFMIFGGNDYQGPEGITEFINKKYVPDFLGGDCFGCKEGRDTQLETTCHIPDGGVVPKSLYMKDDDADKSPDEPTFATDSIYQTTHVVKDYPHEVLIQVPQKNSVITWDFDILKGDITFTVFRCMKQLHEPIHTHHVTGATAGIGSVQYIEKSMAVGAELSIVEPPHICRDGDSIQGSIVTGQPGSYILQWKHFDSAKPSFDFPLSSHKSKVMYYTELLKSEAFKGSMSSLQSFQSSISSLSIGTNQSSQSGLSSCPSRSLK
ncbi:SEC14-like protein 5 isoform X1 [Octopus bimaculoides]|uniref:CRAL-TRIO domain-containing protein n=1 Tax=Octopus bimaculoides TaxID=37653 RepID=A0A0L8HSI8_OCTBM|nr:SEC14-like protein 5 isoform X1 [Octopus bimaculoides]|eukprot:XP_014770135.1 PREDICTED: SEC14-like protein 5 isoform X1 [Octopus bimaculoides]